MPIVYSGEGDFRNDPVLAGLRLRGLTPRDRASERAWRLYTALYVRFERELRGIKLGFLPEGIWVAVRPGNGEDRSYTFAIERTRLHQAYRVGMAVGFQMSARELVDAIREVWPCWSIPEDKWAEVVAAAEKSDVQARKAEARRAKRHAREATAQGLG